MTQEEFHKRYQYSPTNDCLGEGGFGKVFKAYDTHLDKWVAIKMAEVKPGLEHVRLKHEVEIVNKLPTHPNIAKYDECYTFTSFTGEYDFAVLQYYELGNLQQLLETKQLTEQQKDSILRRILAGIEFLHNQGIIHRDLKPQNILIINRNGEYIPKITDFGISKKLNVNKSSVFTNSLAGVGTLAYASPEQLRGQTIKKNTDLWSFGVTVCWIFTGKLPFTSGSQAVTSEAGRIELFKQITSGDVSTIIQQLPSIWSELVKQCIVVDNEKRISNASNCLNILSGMINHYENKTTVIDENTVTDIDGNVYKTIRIGNQIWMAENLRVSRYQNGDFIPNIKDNETWGDSYKGAWCNYDNKQEYDAEYGKLYNWYAVNNEKGLAPKGWHIPSVEEFEALIEYLGGKEIATNKLKAKGTEHWRPNECGTNESGFSALPGGCRKSEGTFRDVGTNGFWWHSSLDDSYDAWYDTGGMGFHYSGVSIFQLYQKDGFSVRCIKNINTEPITDIDGNVYKTVQIGNQVWMAENLRVSRYRNGDLIPNIKEKNKWKNLKTGACCNYENNLAYDAEYGKLYNWFAIDDKRGLAPDGWHIPSLNEWNTLMNYLGGVTKAGGKLKQKGTFHATNEVGFNAQLCGKRSAYLDDFINFKNDGYWWCSSVASEFSAWYKYVNYNLGDLCEGGSQLFIGFSLRCVRDL